MEDKNKIKGKQECRKSCIVKEVCAGKAPAGLRRYVVDYGSDPHYDIDVVCGRVLDTPVIVLQGKAPHSSVSQRGPWLRAGCRVELCFIILAFA